MRLPSLSQNNLAAGIFYFREGLRLIWRPELRLYIVVPLLVNCVLFVALTSVLVHFYGGLLDSLLHTLPSWLAPLAWIAWIVFGILMLIVYGYSFNMITNIIAAPFYGLLAAKAEFLLTGVEPPEESLGKLIPRVFVREIAKLLYFLSRGIIVVLLVLFLATIPGLNLLSPVVGVAWGAWSMSVQYADYAGDNNQLGFKPLRNCLWNKKYSSMGFGGIIMLVSIIPVLNIVAMPVAVVGGTLFWLRELKSCHQGNCALPS